MAVFLGEPKVHSQSQLVPSCLYRLSCYAEVHVPTHTSTLLHPVLSRPCLHIMLLCPSAPSSTHATVLGARVVLYLVHKLPPAHSQEQHGLGGCLLMPLNLLPFCTRKEAASELSPFSTWCLQYRPSSHLHFKAHQRTAVYLMAT